MDDAVKLILRLLLEQAEENDKESSAGNDDEKKHAGKRSGTDHVRADLEKARSRVYPEHTGSIENVPEVPIWEKYALSQCRCIRYFSQAGGLRQ